MAERRDGFGTHRHELEVIAQLVPHGARVLDLGCGDGQMLAYLVQHRGAVARGVEIDGERVRAAIRRGLPVYHGDMIECMGFYSDCFFDVVLCSQTLQEVARPAEAFRQMLRVSRRVIVGFLNYGYWRNRLWFLFAGKKPKSEALPHDWHNTPDIHPLTIREFEGFCQSEAVTIERRIFLRGDWEHEIRWLPNLLAGYAIFVVRCRCA